MLDIVYEFFGLAGLDVYAPTNLADLIPLLLQFVVAVGLVMACFKVISSLLQVFCNWRWFK